MLEIFVLSSMLSGFFWFDADVTLWFVSVLVATIALTKYDNDTYMTSDDIQEGLQKMKTTPCCNLSCFQNPKLIKIYTLNLRLITGILSTISLCITYFLKDDFLNQVQLISACWVVVCLGWFLALIPRLISLLQCAAAQSTPAILRYRNIMSVYLVHDLFLGCFWLYLSVMLYHLVDDNDKEWRKIFITMFWWHLIILAGLTLYTEEKIENKTCCGPKSMNRWRQFFLLFSICISYIIIIERMRTDQLSKMGISLPSLCLFELSLIVAYFCKRKNFSQRNQIERSPKTNTLQMGLFF